MQFDSALLALQIDGIYESCVNKTKIQHFHPDVCFVSFLQKQSIARLVSFILFAFSKSSFMHKKY